MIPKIISLLFFAFCLGIPAFGEDYQVQKGDSASNISQKARIPQELLTKANPDLDWDQLKAGDHLNIPERYLVKPGDTLYSLSRTWGVEQAEVWNFNGLSGPMLLKAGQVLFIPTPRIKSSDAGSWPVSKSPRAEGDRLKSVTFTTAGEPFRSVADGTVVYQGEFRGVGRVLLVQTADKAVFGYGNFESSSVEYGQTVSKGQVLGVTSPRPSQRLSFFAFRQNEPIDVFSLKR